MEVNGFGLDWISEMYDIYQQIQISVIIDRVRRLSFNVPSRCSALLFDGVIRRQFIHRPHAWIRNGFQFSRRLDGHSYTA